MLFGYFDADGIRQTRTLELGDLCRHCCGEQICRPLLRDDLQDFIKYGTEVHVEQSVRLIEDLQQL